MKQQKILIALLCIIICISLQSCTNLDSNPTEFNIPPESFLNVNEMDKGVIGIYNKMVNTTRWTTFYAAAWAGDDITTHNQSNKADFREFDQRSVQPSNNRLLANWNGILDIINTANSVLERSKGLNNLNENDQQVYDRYIGEIHFIRGVMFFHLARVHGRIPLPLTSIPDPNIERATQLEVYKQIESDLLEAEKKLPDLYPSVFKGAPRPNNGSARALLARLYMDWAGFPLKETDKYALAATSAKKVIDNATKHNFGLVSDLESLWTLAGRYNDESVFTLSYCSSCGDFNIANWKFGILGLPLDFDGWQETFSEIKFFQDMPDPPAPSDPPSDLDKQRIYTTRKKATYRFDLDWEKFTDQKSPVLKKITGPKGDLPTGGYITSRSDYYMRYAEVLLIYAEASARSGNNPPEAWEALNKILRRAAGLPYNIPNTSTDLTSGNLAELVVEERKWEFAGEYLRWYDLMRLKLVEQALSNRDPTGQIREHNPITGSLGIDNYFSPVPAVALSNNPNLAK